MTKRQTVGTLSYPLGRSLPRSVAQTRVLTWPMSIVVVLLAAIAIAGLCLFYVWQGTTVLDLTAQRESARTTLTSIQEVNRWLEFEIEKAFSLKRVSRLARDRLHMVEPTNIHYVRLVPDPRQP